MKTDQSHNAISKAIVYFLGINATVLSIGVVCLEGTGATVDAALYTLAAGAIGALGALLTNPQSQRRTDSGPAGTPAGPVSVEAVGVEGGAVVVEEKSDAG